MSGHVLVLVEALPYPLDPRVRAQVAALRDAGHEVTVVSPTGEGERESDVMRDGVRVRSFLAPTAGSGALGYVREYAVALLRMRRVVRAVGSEHPVDVVLVCTPPDFLVSVARPLARRGAAIVFDHREISPELFEAKFGRRGAAHRLLVLAERYALRHADAVTTVSNACAQIACARGGADPRRVFLVGNGPDGSRVYPVPPSPELRRGKAHLVLWLGFMSRQDGLDVLIDVAERVVRDRRREDVHFAIVGQGDVQAPLQDDVDRRGLGEHVELTGAVGDDLVRSYLATADVCVGVDRPNAMNDRAAMRKILEYLALGKAVVQFPLAEMRRLCGDASVYARDGDPADLTERICELLDDEEGRRRLGEAARRRVEGEALLWRHQVPSFLASIATAREARVSAEAGRPPVAEPRPGRRARAGLVCARILPGTQSAGGSDE
jgi:glycosyltransferase involved in cell wall biosynthesis